MVGRCQLLKKQGQKNVYVIILQGSRGKRLSKDQNPVKSVPSEKGIPGYFLSLCRYLDYFPLSIIVWSILPRHVSRLVGTLMYS